MHLEAQPLPNCWANHRIGILWGNYMSWAQLACQITTSSDCLFNAQTTEF